MAFSNNTEDSICRRTPPIEAIVSWYFTMISELNANMPDEFGPYETYELAIAGIQRVMKKTRTSQPSVIRHFSAPYQGSKRPRKEDEE